ncbi:UDP-N-acetylmuramate dehydrogenase [Rariglobus hedericola]|uniref:UDP-N-acetylenolpyruvoylglucosamine reductase n=1 Tax=Rariglobus hedericola TaxID=2597822 RepID=A0A556QEN7_9BACT|nr:UDP-N-acetylmuramate dehydrogenase [Rariglobus hedericola]TSJ75066.1 UDP-N-acetylmuramate dehydrogenase [Rariglobus hedericola]
MSTVLPHLFGHEVTAIHCAGVGGMGVGPLAIYLARRGFRVSGEDDAMVDAMRVQLQRAGVVITGAGEIPADCHLVACSSAIGPAHPVMLAAKARDLRVVRRGELLAEATRDRRLIAVCGSHGKTTTTAMVIAAFRSAGFPAGYVLGGLFADDAIAPASAGSNDWVVAEIDESDGTIASFSPEITVAVNLDWDHPDHYRTAADLERAFHLLFTRTKRAVLVNSGCDFTRNATRQLSQQAITFGETGDYRGALGAALGAHTELSLGGGFPFPAATVQAMGDFNVLNATAALAVAHIVGVEGLSGRALADYPGVRRRQAVLHAAKDLTVIEDYAHHPAEIRALLGSLRTRGDGRLVVVFQPHRFSRTAQFKEAFAAALALSDAVYLLDVYGAGEAPIAGGTTRDLENELKRTAPALPVVYHEGDPGATLSALSAGLKPGDFVAFVGAGDIDGMARGWLAAIEAARWDAVAAALREVVSPQTKVKREESLARKTTIGLGGAARIYAEPADMADLQALVKTAKARALPLIILGRGSNLVVPDEGVDGLVISLRQPAWEIFEPRADGHVWAGAGLRLKNLCGLAAKAGLVGFEFLEGIPGNLGGALRMNAGAMGGWMFDVVDSVSVMTFDGEVRTLKKSEMHVDYRHCAELHDAIALGALLKPASQSEAASIAKQIEAYKEKRQKSQPREPSAGCIFKNPPNDSAGRLIDASGLKGERVGDAEVSTIHANFIVNRGDATAGDVIELVRRVRARVEQAQGVTLEPEVLLYGKQWKDVL